MVSNDSFVSFDAMQQRVVDMLESDAIPDEITPIYLVRDLFGKVRILLGNRQVWIEQAPELPYIA